MAHGELASPFPQKVDVPPTIKVHRPGLFHSDSTGTEAPGPSSSPSTATQTQKATVDIGRRGAPPNLTRDTTRSNHHARISATFKETGEAVHHVSTPRLPSVPAKKPPMLATKPSSVKNTFQGPPNASGPPLGHLLTAGIISEHEPQPHRQEKNRIHHSHLPVPQRQCYSPRYDFTIPFQYVIRSGPS